MTNSNNLVSTVPHKDSHNFTISEISSKTPMQTNCSNANNKIEIKEPLWKCRYAIVLLGFWIFWFLMAYRLNISVTLVAMVNNTASMKNASVKSQSCPSLISNITSEQDLNAQKGGEFSWSPKIQGYILSSFAVGYVLMQIPAGLLVERFGSKWLLFSASFITGVCTLLIPPISRTGAWSLVAVNAVRGVAQAMMRPSMCILTANWFPIMERGLLYSITMSGSAFGSFLSGGFSGLLCEYAGWSSSFYTLGGAAIVLSMCIAVYIHESPKDHPGISQAERDFILNNQECALSKRRPNVPWRKILTSVPVYALLLVSFGQSWGIAFFSIVQPLYLGTILHYPISRNGLFTALPFLFEFVVIQATAFVSGYLQKKNIASVNTLRKLNTLLAAVGCSACFLGIYFAGCNRHLSIIFGVVALAITGAGFSGCWITSTDMSPQFSGSLNGFCTTFSSTSTIILPLVVGYLTNERQTIEEWNKVMFISFGVVLVTGIIFEVFGSAKIQPWNFVEQTKSEKGEDIKDSEDEKEYEITRF